MIRLPARDRSPETSKRPLLIYLQAILPSLNPVERLIAQYVLDDPERILSSSIADLRRGSGASVGSIIGFCRSLGVKGFADFKITLARELSHGELSAAQRPPENGSVFQNVFEFQSQNLRETLQLNSADELEKVARALELARRIEFFSIGMSYPVAYTASAKLKLIGLRTAAECDSHLQMINATQLRKGDVAFGISCSGSTTETVRCLEIARQGRATTLCVTNCMKSPITAPGRHGALRHSQRNQVFSSAAGLAHHPIGAGGRPVRFHRPAPQEPHPGPIAKRRHQAAWNTECERRNVQRRASFVSFFQQGRARPPPAPGHVVHWFPCIRS